MENQKQIFKIVLIFGLSCIISLLLYVIANKVMQNIVGIEANGYLSNSIQWFSRPIKDSVYAIANYIKGLIFSNETTYSSIVYGIIFLVFFVGGY